MAVKTQTTSTMQMQQLKTTTHTLPILSTSTLLTIITPALTNTLVFFGYLQLILRSYALTTAAVLLTHSFKIGRGLMINSLILSQILLSNIIRATLALISHSYKRSEPLRNKLFFEFMIFILNPGLGHGLCVFLFWPGWILVWPFVFAYWLFG